MVGGKHNVLVHYVNAGSPDQAVVVVVCVVVCDFVCMFTFKLFLFTTIAKRILYHDAGRVHSPCRCS